MTETSRRVAVKVENLTKTFRIPTEASSGIKQKLINTLRGKKGYREFTPLDGVSFEIEEGDFFGIVGRNGSGKSTLLKTMAGIYSPNKGSITVNGSLVPFIELGVGFNPELTGRENVFLNGALLGFSRTEMNEMYDEIVEFAELGDFMDERLKNYSSGMQVRLAFSIAIKAEGDVLLLDEVLAVGDESFQRKCYNYFSELKRNKKTVILVTHDMGAVEKYCNKALMIEKGRIVKKGTNAEVADAYRELFMHEATKNGPTSIKLTKMVSDVSTDIVDINMHKIENVKALESFAVHMKFIYEGDKSPGAVGLSIRNSQGVTIIAIGTGTIYDNAYTLHPGVNEVKFVLDKNILTNDSYTVDVAIAMGPQDNYQELIFQQSNAAHFQTKGVLARPHSLVHPKFDVVTSYE